MNSIFIRQQVLCIIAYPVHLTTGCLWDTNKVESGLNTWSTAASIIFTLFNRFLSCKKCEGKDGILKTSGKSPAHPVSTPDCGSWEALVPALQECSWSLSCCQGTAGARICSIHLRIPKREWNLGSQPQKSRNNNSGQAIIIIFWKPSKTVTKHHICYGAVVLLQECPCTILHLGQNEYPGFKGCILIYYCRFVWDSGTVFLKNIWPPSHQSPNHSVRQHLRCTRHDMLCESICQGATALLTTTQQTPSSDLHVSSTKHNAQAPVPRAREASQAFVLTAAAWPSMGKCHCTSPMHHPANAVCDQPHCTTAHCNPSAKTLCFKERLCTISILSPSTLGSNAWLSLIWHSFSLHPFSMQSLLKYSAISAATSLSDGHSNCPTTNLLVSTYTHSNFWCQELKKLSNPPRWTKECWTGASLIHILCSTWTKSSLEFYYLELNLEVSVSICNKWEYL